MKNSSLINERKEEVNAERLLSGGLFDRPHPKEYVEEWLKLMEEARGQERVDGVSVMVFRLNEEWFGLPTVMIDRITPIQFIHKLPFKSNLVVLGVTNIEGELRITISMRALLGLGKNITLNDNRLYSRHKRAIVIRKELDYFVFPVDEVYGNILYEEEKSENVPNTVSNASEHFTKTLFSYEDKRIGLLDVDLIIESIKTDYL